MNLQVSQLIILVNGFSNGRSHNCNSQVGVSSGTLGTTSLLWTHLIAQVCVVGCREMSQAYRRSAWITAAARSISSININFALSYLKCGVLRANTIPTTALQRATLLYTMHCMQYMYSMLFTHCAGTHTHLNVLSFSTALYAACHSCDSTIHNQQYSCRQRTYTRELSWRT
jgi:hypothetical protein